MPFGAPVGTNGPRRTLARGGERRTPGPAVDGRGATGSMTSARWTTTVAARMAGKVSGGGEKRTSGLPRRYPTGWLSGAAIMTWIAGGIRSVLPTAHSSTAFIIARRSSFLSSVAVVTVRSRAATRGGWSALWR